jgi:hypothetical protein
VRSGYSRYDRAAYRYGRYGHVGYGYGYGDGYGSYASSSDGCTYTYTTRGRRILVCDEE